MFDMVRYAPKVALTSMYQFEGFLALGRVTLERQTFCRRFRRVDRGVKAYFTASISVLEQ